MFEYDECVASILIAVDNQLLLLFEIIDGRLDVVRWNSEEFN